MIIMVLSHNVSLQSNPVYMDTEVAIESFCIKGMSVLSGLNLEKIIRTFFLLGQSNSGCKESQFCSLPFGQGVVSVY